MKKKNYFFSRIIIFLVIIISVLVLEPNLFYAQELSWKSTNGPMGGVVGDIAINSKGEIFAGMYPLLQNGLYKSTDNGNSWNKIQSQFEDFSVYCIYISSAGYIWVGTDQQARSIYLSTDNGQTWQMKNNGYNTAECWAIGESMDGTLFAGNGDAGPIYRSTNNGNSWIFSDSIAPLSFATDSNNTVYAGSFSSGLYSTTDNGVTWQHNNNFPNFPVASIIIDNNGSIYCGTGYYSNGDGIYYSNDSGFSWTQFGLLGKVVLSLAFDSGENLYAGTLNDGLFVTSDFGQNWRQYQRGLYRKDVYRLKINTEDDIFIGAEGNGVTGYGDGGVFRSTNGGYSFDQVGLPVSLVKNIVFSGDSLIIAATPSGVQKYNRASMKWNNIGLYKVEAVAITPSNYLYAATEDEGLYKSTDLGKSWTSTNLTADTLMEVNDVLAINDDTLFASTIYNLRRSYNGGKNWDILSINSGPGMYINNNILWVIGFQSHQEVLYKTTDLGNSFDSIYAGFDTFDLNNPIAAIDNGYVFLTSRDVNLIGMTRSKNEGSSWEQIFYNSNTIPVVFANNNGIVITASTVFSSSDTNKIYISTNYGDTWTGNIQPTPFGTEVINIVQSQTKEFYFCTSTNGLYKIDLITDVKEELSNKYNFYLSQNYPNPFNPSTTINYSIPVSGIVKIIVYNVLGQEIKTLVNKYQKSGNYKIKFEGSQLPTGVYFYRISNGHYSATKKMLLIR